MGTEGPARPPAPQPEQEPLAQELERVRQNLEQQLGNWAALNEIAVAIASTPDEGAVLRQVTASVRHALDAELAVLLLLNQESSELRPVATCSAKDTTEQWPLASPFPRTACLALERSSPLLVPDRLDEPAHCSVVEQLIDLGPPSILCTPLQTKGHTIGVLELIGRSDHLTQRSFSQEDLELLLTLTPWVAVIAENASLSRSAYHVPAATAIKQIVVALAHHINNRLMAFSLELDESESQKKVWRDDDVQELLDMARRHIWQISAVVKALDVLEEIRAVPYLGTTDMADLEQALNDQLRNSE